MCITIAATGMINLRARMYEPAMNRFSQKDMLRGNAFSPLSLNRYLYVENYPVNFGDSSGNISVTQAAGYSVPKPFIDAIVPHHFKVIDTKQNVAEDINKIFGGSAKLTDREKEIIQKAQNEMDALQKAGKLTPVEKNRILGKAFMDIALSPANAKQSSNLVGEVVVHFVQIFLKTFGI